MRRRAASTCVRDGTLTNGGVLYLKTTGVTVNTGWLDLATASGADAVTPDRNDHGSYGGSSAPTGWLICDGTAISRSAYSTLFGVLGTTYGVGDGSTTFNLPDLRGRVTAGWAASGGHGDVATLGANDSQALANRRPKHRTTNTLSLSDTIGINDPNHSHNTNIGGGGTTYTGQPAMIPGNALTHSDQSPPATINTSSASTGISKTGTVSMSGSIGTNNANDALDTPSYIVLNHIIKT